MSKLTVNLNDITDQPGAYRLYFAALLGLLGRVAFHKPYPDSRTIFAIQFYGADGSLVSIYRTAYKGLDEELHYVQDEIHLNHSNRGIQINFTVDPNGNVQECHPDTPQLMEGMQGIVDQIRHMQKMEGSSIYCRNSHFYVSDGENWVQAAHSAKVELLPGQPLLNS